MFKVCFAGKQDFYIKLLLLLLKLFLHINFFSQVNNNHKLKAMVSLCISLSYIVFVKNIQVGRKISVY